MEKDLQDSELYEKIYHVKEKRSNMRFVAVLLVFVLLFFGVRAYWVNNFVGVEVDGSSMRNTLIDGDWLIMKKTKDGKGAKRGDIIVVEVDGYQEVISLNATKPKSERLQYLIKRLIAIEGDTVYCQNGQIYIQYAGETGFDMLDEPYAYYGEENEATINKRAYNFSEYTVKKGEIFFLGDNRTPNGSVDSRWKEGMSHLKNPGRLYQRTDIVGVVPNWALKHQSILEKIFI